jgi:hypothetical protein
MTEYVRVAEREPEERGDVERQGDVGRVSGPIGSSTAITAQSGGHAASR